jgi:RHS repeat-associated protein
MGRTQDYWQCNPAAFCSTSTWHSNYLYKLTGEVYQWIHPDQFTLKNAISTARRITAVQSSVSDQTHPQYLVQTQGASYTPWGALSKLVNGCVGSQCTKAQETYVYNDCLQPWLIELGANGGNLSSYYCLVYNYYSSWSLPSGCPDPTTTGPPSGTTDNGNVNGYWYQDNSAYSWFSHSAAYSYDSVNRLTGAVATAFGPGTVSYNLSFSYTRDNSNGQYGNMSCVSNIYTNGLCTNLSFNAANNQITTSGYTYDAAGNLTKDSSNPTAHTYQWDGEGRVSSVDSGSTWSFTYNALGHRARWAFTGGAAQHLFDPTGTWLGIYGSYTLVPFGGRNLVVYESSQTLFNHVNALGSTTMWTNQNGTEVEDILFYPWGDVWQTQGSGGYNFAYLPYYDTATTTELTTARVTSPNFGRWFTPDPAGKEAVRLDDPQTWNMYAYARNNPTTNVDPDGLDFMIACTQQSDTCGQVAGYSGLYQGATASTGENGELQFTATVVTQTSSGDLEDQNGMSYTGYFDQGGVHLTSLDSSVSGSGQFVEGSKETDLYGAGTYQSTIGKFIDACGGSCKARGSLYDTAYGTGAVKAAEGQLNQRGGFTTALDRLSGAHDPGKQWMDSAGLDHVIAFSAGVNKGKTELHFEGSPVQGIDVIPHLAGAFKDLVDGSAAAHRAVVLP